MEGLRFVGLMSMISFLTLICKNAYAPTELTSTVYSVGWVVSDVLDFPYSPVRLVVLMLPADASLPSLRLRLPRAPPKPMVFRGFAIAPSVT